MRRFVVLFLLVMPALIAASSACASRTAPAVPAAPRYPGFLFPGLPQELASQAPLATRHMAAWQRLQAGDLRAAEHDFKWVTERSPAYFPSETGLGFVALARKEYKQALQHFELGLAVSPRYAPALVGRGDALFGLGRQGEAVASYEDALSANPSLTELRARIDALRFKGLEDQVALARRARDIGRLDEAIVAYQRAIASSPESGFLYRELAAVEHRTGRSVEGLEHARKAAALDPGDARAHVLAGEILESQQLYKEAVAEYEAAAAIESSDDTRARLDAARTRADLAALPPEFQAIPTEPSITRAQLAALIGVRFDNLLDQAPRRTAPVMTDTRGSWAAPWIVSVVRSGIMDPFPNHTFQPAALVRRSDLALALAQLLPIAVAGRPEVLATWREARPTLTDLPPSHLIYPAAALAVEAGVLMPLGNNAFLPGRIVSGQEAIDAIDRVDAIWRGRR
jgi:tetratricopeptide (TPR) repeat protein